MTSQGIAVKLVGKYGNDETVAQRAWLCTGSINDNRQEHIENVIDFLIKHKHMKPFESVLFDFEITLPICIDRQLVTYRTLVASLAQSGRFGSVKDHWHVPFEIGASDSKTYDLYNKTMEKVFAIYHELCDQLVPLYGKKRARELARNVLPQGQMTIRCCQINLRNVIHLIVERTAPEAQREIQDIAKKMLILVGSVAPLTVKSLIDQGILSKDCTH
jgi:flavin-dependent thymidylate synthase